MSFELLNIRKEIVKGLDEEGIKTPTQIQELSIPLIIKGKDLIGISNTGSGKTAAFGIPVLESLQPNAGLQTLILAPTRELAVQIASELKKFGKYTKPKITAVYGGVSLEPQVKAMKTTDILVGTPGRLLDHLERNTLNLRNLRQIIIDEADKMVEMGFIEDVRKLIKASNDKRQIILFGATISKEVEGIKNEFMRKPETIKAALQVKTNLLEQYYYPCEMNEKFSLLVHFLKTEDPKLAIVFCSTRTTVELVTNNLRKNKIRAEMIHGKLTQKRRLQVVENFKKGNPHVLVASAVAARGIHVDNVSHVFNYDLSNDPEEYIHRVGRTARAGEKGKAITFLSHRDYGCFNEILGRFNLKISEMDKVEFEKLRFHVNKDGGRRGPSRGGPRRDGRRDSDRTGSKFSRGGPRRDGRRDSDRTGSKFSRGSSRRDGDRRNDSRGRGSRSSTSKFSR